MLCRPGLHEVVHVGFIDFFSELSYNIQRS